MLSLVFQPNTDVCSLVQIAVILIVRIVKLKELDADCQIVSVLNDTMDVTELSMNLGKQSSFEVFCWEPGLV